MAKKIKRSLVPIIQKTKNNAKILFGKNKRSSVFVFVLKKGIFDFF